MYIVQLYLVRSTRARTHVACWSVRLARGNMAVHMVPMAELVIKLKLSRLLGKASAGGTILRVRAGPGRTALPFAYCLAAPAICLDACFLAVLLPTAFSWLPVRAASPRLPLQYVACSGMLPRSCYERG